MAAWKPGVSHPTGNGFEGLHRTSPLHEDRITPQIPAPDWMIRAATGSRSSSEAQPCQPLGSAPDALAGESRSSADPGPRPSQEFWESPPLYSVPPELARSVAPSMPPLRPSLTRRILAKVLFAVLFIPALLLCAQALAVACDFTWSTFGKRVAQIVAH